MTDTIRFRLFGDLQIFSLSENEWKPLNSFSDKSIGKKQRAFLAYLLLNHTRKITAAELMEHFWADDRKDPANSLKNMLHKVRTLLRTAFPEQEDLLMTQAGGYLWNSNYTVEVDVTVFEALYRRAKTAPTAAATRLEAEAAELYSGDILPGVSLEWLDHLNTYYRTIYIDICKSLASALREQEEWEDVIRICKQAYQLAPEVEEFTTHAMYAMILSGMPSMAIKQYENYRTLLLQEYNLVPSARVEQLHDLANDSNKSNADFENELISQLTQPAEDGSAYQCSMLVFHNMVQLELRHIARSKHASSIVVLRIETFGEKEPTPTDIRRLERTLLRTLRAGDPFTRLNKGSFALLLSTANEENAGKVVERIERDFRMAYPRSHGLLHSRIWPLVCKNDAQNQV